MKKDVTFTTNIVTTMPEKNANNENLSLVNYESLLRQASVEKSNRVFPNNDKDHAAIALSVLFDNVSKNGKIDLIVDCFKDDVTNNDKYVKSIDDAISKGVSIRVISLDPINTNSITYNKLIEYKSQCPEKVKIDEATPEVRQSLINSIKTDDIVSELYSGQIFNLALVDDNKYRLEFLPSKYMAFLSFDNSAFVFKCRKMFNTASNLLN